MGGRPARPVLQGDAPMQANATRRARVLGILCAVFACVLLVGAEAADAQMGGGRRRGGGGGRPKKPKGPTQDVPEQADAPGQQTGRIVKFKPAKEDEEDENLLGMLSVRPFRKGQKTLKMSVRRADTLRIELGDAKIEGEDILEYMWKGLHCTAGWAFENPDKKKPKKKELRSLRLDSLIVSGKIDKIEDDLIVIKARPKNGQNWPDLAAKQDPGKNPTTKKKIILRKLKLKILEDVSKFVDAKKEELDLDEFEVGKKVDATVVYGRPFGILLVLQSSTADDKPQEAGEPEKPRDEGNRGKGRGRPKRPGGPRGI